MMQRGAQSDQQQEEHAIFRETANALDLQLMKGGSGDATPFIAARMPTLDSFYLELPSVNLLKIGKLMRLFSNSTMLINFNNLLNLL